MKSDKFVFGPWQEAWLQSLESGKLEQADGQLCISALDDGEITYSFCCLGVACEVLSQNGARIKITEYEPNYWELAEDGYCGDIAYDKQSAYLPEKVKDRMNFHHKTGGFDDEYIDGLNCDERNAISEFDTLADMNDDGQTFEQIAALVRKHPRLVFSAPDKGK